ncbi:hypothetical protein [Enterobacter mori]|uniref:hypothetical protein n=1 Tax=Enterobacter mori TaxID=539813 RepID=UPI001BDFDC5D|nr:hypothetical protein [Enterobacter mori]MBT1885902.1 hypothetical protein [Enterobacter mori]MCW4857644.1 hypothetical protein [Enterobacter mori]
MKKRTIAILCLVFFAAGALISWLYHLRLEKMENTEACSASIVVYHENARANITLDFMYTMKTQTGIVAVSGTYYKNDKVAGVIRRDVSYVWTENKDSFHFTSLNIQHVNDDESLPNDVISDVLPDFFVYPNKKMNYSITKQGPKGFMFSVGKRPIFFCAR